jgi:predicted regulator of Ras-like GTPase activity (Roadblock/LC7/MglB family)
MDALTGSALTALRDIEGVLGSFLLDPDGQVLARDLPPLFDVDALANASVHLSRLRAALEVEGNSFECCVARFGPHLLLLRAAQANTLCVLCPRGTNMPAVHMSTTLVARRIVNPSGGRTSSPSLPPPEPDPLGLSPTGQSPDGSPSRRFRGRRV